jgi:hypothetical protein
MLKFDEAIKEYIKVIHDFHKLTLFYANTIISSASIKHDSKWTLLDGENPLIKVYRINGYIKYTIWSFYNKYVKDSDIFMDKYCKENKIKHPDINFDIKQLMTETKEIMLLLENNFDTSPPLTAVSDAELLELIRLMFKSIDMLMSLEYKLRSIPDYSKLDLQAGKSFKFFRSNYLFDRMENILLSYPQSGNLRSCKTFFTATLNELTEGKDSWFDEK